MGRGIASLLAATVALGCAGAPPAPQPAPQVGTPLFPPGDDHWLENVRPVRASSSTPSVDRSAPTSGLIATCTRDMEAGKALCRALTGGDDADCIKVCSDSYATSHPAQQAEMAHPAAASVAPASPSTPSMSASASIAAPPPDPYFFALRDCILRMRDSGGSEPPTCRFDRPLDEMDFGQAHCDAKCAALSEPYRRPGSTRPDEED